MTHIHSGHGCGIEYYFGVSCKICRLHNVSKAHSTFQFVHKGA